MAAVKINPQYHGRLARALDPIVRSKSKVRYPLRPKQAGPLEAFAIGK